MVIMATPPIHVNNYDSNIPNKNLIVEGNFMSSTIQWIREPGEYENLRKITSLILAAFLSLTIVGLIIVIPGAVEWYRQSNLEVIKSDVPTKDETVSYTTNTATNISKVFK